MSYVNQRSAVLDIAKQPISVFFKIEVSYQQEKSSSAETQRQVAWAIAHTDPVCVDS